MAWIRACGGGSPAVPNGKTVTPINDVTIWQQCAGIANPTYTTLAEILADTGILQTLMASDNAVDYLVRCKSFIGNLALVPKMTSNTTPSGVAIASMEAAGAEAYKAFDGDNSTSWSGSETSNSWVGYDFGEKTQISEFFLYPEGAGNTAPSGCRVKNYKIEGSDDGLNWTTLTTKQYTASNATGDNYELSANYRYYRCYVEDNYSSGSFVISIGTLQFKFKGITDNANAMTYIGQNNYASNTLLADSDWRSAICNSTYFESILNVKIPVMTSNTTPSGVASAKNYYGSGFEAYRAFDGTTDTSWTGSAAGTSTSNNYLQYAFGTKKKIYKADVNFSSYCTAVSFRMQGINSGVITDLTDTLNVRNGSAVFSKNINEYDSYRFQIDTYTQNVSVSCPRMDEAQLYGREDV